MLVLTRKSGEAIRLGGHIQLVVLSIARDHVRLGIAAPPGVTVLREEVYQRIADANRAAALGDDVPRPEGSGAAELAFELVVPEEVP